MDGVIGTDKEIGPNARKLRGGGEHKFANALYVAAAKALDIVGKGGSVYGNLRMSVRTKKARSFRADCSITKCCAFGGASNDPDVLRHGLKIGLYDA